MDDKLIIVIPSHGYQNGDYIYYSILNEVFVVSDTETNSFLLKHRDTGEYVLVSPVPVYSGYTAKVLSSSSTLTAEGLEFLAGSTVSVLINNVKQGDYTVQSDGTVTFPNPLASDVKVGLPFTSMARTLRLDINVGGQTSQSNVKRISKIVPRIVNSGAIQMKAAEETIKETISFSNISEDIGRNIMSGYETRATVEFSSVDEKPLTILSAVIALEYKQ